MEETTETAGQLIERTAHELGLAMRAEFVPFSKSRNAKPNPEKLALSDLSLNWRVSLLKYDPTLAKAAPGPYREFLATDYSAGVAHCPSYQWAPSWERDALVRAEVETGKKNRFQFGKPAPHGIHTVAPKLADVLYSLAMDVDVLDAGSFEEWASNYGYDTDSRKAEVTYRACLEIALKLRNGLGEDGLRRLRDAVAEC
jgi:hypothetical protein